MVFKIVSNGKSDKKQYKFNDVSISEVQILKHLKKPGVYLNLLKNLYPNFSSRKLEFIEMLNENVILNLLV